MANRVITISRQFGSGGRTVGRMTAMKLGIPCYDQELIQKVAEAVSYTHLDVYKRQIQQDRIDPLTVASPIGNRVSGNQMEVR